MNPYDVIIIGGSYSGMSAAMALGRSRRNTLVIDAGDPCNKSTPYSHNFLTQDGVAPSEISTIAKDQVLSYPTIHWHHGSASDIMDKKGTFEVILNGGKTVVGRRLILASGLKDQIPEIPGFEACWGKTIIHCPYCHGYEFRDQKTGILAQADQALEMVKLISNWTDQLRLFLTGSKRLDNEQSLAILDKGIQIVNQPILEVVHNKGILEHLIMSKNTIEPIKVLYAKLPTEQKIPWIQTIGCIQSETGHIQVDMFGKTTVEGIYAVGDCAHPMRSVATAVYTGNIAGAMINKEFIEEDF
ncbi:MAG: NAD(P)/FAD-dependent oxidoreductase [Bacteroidota bacterium]